MKVKLGQVIQFKKDYTIELSDGGTAKIRCGDTARVVRKVDEKTGEIIYITGEAKGKSQNIRLEVDESLDIDSIAKKVMEELNK